MQVSGCGTIERRKKGALEARAMRCSAAPLSSRVRRLSWQFELPGHRAEAPFLELGTAFGQEIAHDTVELRTLAPTVHGRVLERA